MIYLVKGNSELIRSAVLLRSDEITTLWQSPKASRNVGECAAARVWTQGNRNGATRFGRARLHASEFKWNP